MSDHEYESERHHVCPNCATVATATESRCRNCGRSLSTRRCGNGRRRVGGADIEVASDPTGARSEMQLEPTHPRAEVPNAGPTMQPPRPAPSRSRFQWRRLPWRRVTAYYFLSYPFVALTVFIGWQRHRGIGVCAAQVAIDMVAFPILVGFVILMVYVMVAFLVNFNRCLNTAMRPVPSPAQIAYQLEVEWGRPATVQEVAAVQQMLLNGRNEALLGVGISLGALYLIDHNLHGK